MSDLLVIIRLLNRFFLKICLKLSPKTHRHAGCDGSTPSATGGKADAGRSRAEASYPGQQWFRSVQGAVNKIQGYEAMNMIRKGQVRWIPKGDIAGQVRFVNRAFG